MTFFAGDLPGWMVPATIGLGVGLIIFALIFFLMAVTTLVSLYFFKKNKTIPFPSVALTFFVITESTIRSVLRLFGFGTDWLIFTFIELENYVGKTGFKKTEYSDRIIFIPQCIRHKKCPAKSDYEGLHCIHCGLCSIDKLQLEAEHLGYRFFIAPGSSLVKRMTKKYEPSATLGLGCLFEIKEFLQLMSKMKVTAQGVVLNTRGCVETTYDLEKFRKVMKSKAVN